MRIDAVASAIPVQARAPAAPARPASPPPAEDSVKISRAARQLAAAHADADGDGDGK